MLSLLFLSPPLPHLPLLSKEINPYPNTDKNVLLRLPGLPQLQGWLMGVQTIVTQGPLLKSLYFIEGSAFVILKFLIHTLGN